MKRIALAAMSALICCAVAASAATAPDEAAQKRREKWLEHQKQLNERGILKLEAVVAKGDPSNRVNIVFIGDGFDKTEMPRYKTITDKLIAGMLGLQPMSNFSNYINVYRLYLQSEPNEFTLKSEVSGRNMFRILNCDRAEAESLAKFAPESDLVVVVSDVTSNARANASGPVIMLWARASIAPISVHEFGHAFAGLADEYTIQNRFERRGFNVPEVEPWNVNVTLESEPLLSKWHYWVEPPAGDHRKVTNEEGALYIDKGVYRPERSCVMKSEGTQFCSVCLEQMVRTFFRRIDPIESQTPDRVNVVVCKGEKVPLTARALDYEDSENKTRVRMDWRWYLDNAAVEPKPGRSAASTYEFNGETATPGIHEVVVSGDVNDPRVRRDHGMMSDARFWRVEVLNYPRPRITVPAKKDVKPGEKISFDLKLQNAEPSLFKTSALGLPKGAKFDDFHGKFEWTPANADNGAHLIEFVLANDKVDQRAAMLVVVRKGAQNKEPMLVDVADEDGFEGQPFDFTVKGEDPDGDSLLYNVTFKDATRREVLPAPEGVSFDRRSGRFSWRPGFAQAGTYPVTVEATDGMNAVTSNIILNVDNTPVSGDTADGLFRNKKDMNFDFCMLLRSPDAGLRAGACSRLQDMPLAFRAAQLARLLRDQDDAIRGDALGQVHVLSGAKNANDFLGVFFREMSGKVWQFTDFDEALTLMRKLVDGARGTQWPAMTKSCIGNIDQYLRKAQLYNAKREQARKKADEEKQKKAAEDKTPPRKPRGGN